MTQLTENKDPRSFVIAIFPAIAFGSREASLNTDDRIKITTRSQAEESTLRFVEQFFQILLPDGSVGVGAVAVSLL